MSNTEDDALAQTPRPEDDAAKTAFDESSKGIGDDEPADGADDSDPNSPNAE